MEGSGVVGVRFALELVAGGCAYLGVGREDEDV